jgi:hypothetical protein
MTKAKLALFVCLVVLWPKESSAFYARGYFGFPADLGGGGRLYYTGSRIERGWDCRACHIDSPGIVRVTFVTNPPELIAEKRYVPGTSYNIDAVLENETRGLDSKYNSNGMLAEISSGNDPAGELKAGPGTELLENGRVVGSTSDANGIKRWTFSWTAPARGAGAVTIYLGAVDGNGAGDRETARQDHLGDDVYVARLMLAETASAGPSSLIGPMPNRSRFEHGRRTGVASLLLFACSLLVAIGSFACQRLRA